MKLNPKYLTLAVVAVLALAAAFGYSLVPFEALAAAGALPFVLGDTDDMGSLKTILEDQGKAWEEFKRTNDERLTKLAKGEAVGDLEAKLAKLNEAITEQSAALKQLQLAQTRPNLSSEEAKSEAKELKRFNAVLQSFGAEKGRPVNALSAEGYSEYKAALSAYIRRGAQQLTGEEAKAINVGTDPQGGYLVGEEMEAGIDRVVRRFSGIRSISRVIPIGAASYKKLVKTSGTSGGTRGGETTAPTEGTSPNWAELEFRPGTYLSDQRITAEALEDAVQDVESDLMEEIGIEFAEMEGADFVSGAGVNGPRGLTSYDIVTNASYAWGKVGYVASGGASGFASSNPSDYLIDLQHSLKRQYRAGANWVMNDATLGTIRKFKDGQGLYLWAPSALMQGAVGQLLGHPVVTDDFMADLGSNTYPIAFGDFSRAYYVIERRGIAILRDPYTQVPYVKFVARRRVGGGIANFEAVKLLKCATS